MWRVGDAFGQGYSLCGLLATGCCKGTLSDRCATLTILTVLTNLTVLAILTVLTMLTILATLQGYSERLLRYTSRLETFLRLYQSQDGGEGGGGEEEAELQARAN